MGKQSVQLHSSEAPAEPQARVCSATYHSLVHILQLCSTEDQYECYILGATGAWTAPIVSTRPNPDALACMLLT